MKSHKKSIKQKQQSRDGFGKELVESEKRGGGATSEIKSRTPEKKDIGLTWPWSHEILQTLKQPGTNKTIQDTLKSLLKSTESHVDECLTKEKPNRSKKLASEIKNVVSACHLKIQMNKLEDLSDEVFHHLSALLSIYMDLNAIYCLKKVEKKKKYGREVGSYVLYVLQNHSESLFEVVLQSLYIADPQKKIRFFNPFIRQVAMTEPSYSSHQHYLKHVLVIKSVINKFDETVSTEMALHSKKMMPLNGLHYWLRRTCPKALQLMELKKKKTFASSKISIHLILRDNDELVSVLEESLCAENGEDAVSKADKAVLGEEDLSKVQLEQTDSLFIIDKGKDTKQAKRVSVGNSKKLKKLKTVSKKGSMMKQKRTDNLFFIDKEQEKGTLEVGPDSEEEEEEGEIVSDEVTEDAVEQISDLDTEDFTNVDTELQPKTDSVNKGHNVSDDVFILGNESDSSTDRKLQTVVNAAIKNVSKFGKSESGSDSSPKSVASLTKRKSGSESSQLSNIKVHSPAANRVNSIDLTLSAESDTAPSDNDEEMQKSKLDKSDDEKMRNESQALGKVQTPKTNKKGAQADDICELTRSSEKRRKSSSNGSDGQSSAKKKNRRHTAHESIPDQTEKAKSPLKHGADTAMLVGTPPSSQKKHKDDDHGKIESTKKIQKVLDELNDSATVSNSSIDTLTDESELAHTTPGGRRMKSAVHVVDKENKAGKSAHSPEKVVNTSRKEEPVEFSDVINLDSDSDMENVNQSANIVKNFNEGKKNAEKSNESDDVIIDSDIEVGRCRKPKSPKKSSPDKNINADMIMPSDTSEDELTELPYIEKYLKPDNGSHRKPDMFFASKLVPINDKSNEVEMIESENISADDADDKAGSEVDNSILIDQIKTPVPKTDAETVNNGTNEVVLVTDSDNDEANATVINKANVTSSGKKAKKSVGEEDSILAISRPSPTNSAKKRLSDASSASKKKKTPKRRKSGNDGEILMAVESGLASKEEMSSDETVVLSTHRSRSPRKSVLEDKPCPGSHSKVLNTADSEIELEERIVTGDENIFEEIQDSIEKMASPRTRNRTPKRSVGEGKNLREKKTPAKQHMADEIEDTKEKDTRGQITSPKCGIQSPSPSKRKVEKVDDPDVNDDDTMETKVTEPSLTSPHKKRRKSSRSASESKADPENEAIPTSSPKKDLQKKEAEIDEQKPDNIFSPRSRSRASNMSDLKAKPISDRKGDPDDNEELAGDQLNDKVIEDISKPVATEDDETKDSAMNEEEDADDNDLKARPTRRSSRAKTSVSVEGSVEDTEVAVTKRPTRSAKMQSTPTDVRRSGRKKEVYEFTSDSDASESENPARRSTRRSVHFQNKMAAIGEQREEVQEDEVEKTPAIKQKPKGLSASTSKKVTKTGEGAKPVRKRRLSGEFSTSDAGTADTVGSGTDSEISFPHLKKTSLRTTPLKSKSNVNESPKTRTPSRRTSLRKK